MHLVFCLVTCADDKDVFGSFRFSTCGLSRELVCSYSNGLDVLHSNGHSAILSFSTSNDVVCARLGAFVGSRVVTFAIYGNTTARYSLYVTAEKDPWAVSFIIISNSSARCRLKHSAPDGQGAVVTTVFSFDQATRNGDANIPEIEVRFCTYAF